MDKYIENIAEIEKAIEEIKARMTPDEAAAAEAAEAEQEAEDPNDPTTYHDAPAGRLWPMRLTARAVRPKSAPSAMQMWMQTHCSATIAAHSCKQVTRLSNSNLYCFLDKTVE